MARAEARGRCVRSLRCAVDFKDIDEKGDRCMRTMRRIRNAAFLGLVVTLASAGQVKLSADQGGYFACYGYCTVRWDCADTAVNEYIFMDNGGACIRITHCAPSEITVDTPSPWTSRMIESGPAYADFEVYDGTIYESGYGGCDFTIPIPEGE